jgi:hypothetical protein
MPVTRFVTPKLLLSFALLGAWVGLAQPALADDPEPVDWSQSAPPPVYPKDLIKSERTVALKSNDTVMLTMPVKGLGDGFNYETPCFGFTVSGPGVDLAAALLAPFGKITEPLDGGATPADIGGVQQPDGSWAIPDTVGVLNNERLKMGVACASVGWSWYGADGKPSLGPHQEPLHASAAAKRKRRARLARLKHQLVGHDAAMGPVTIQVAGMESLSNFDIRMVLVIRTGKLAGPTTVAMHAEVAKQAKLPNVPPKAN